MSTEPILPDEGEHFAAEMPAALPEPPQREPFWGYVDVALVFGLMFAFSAVVLVVIALLSVRYPKLRTDPMSIAMPVQIAFYLAVYLAFRIAFSVRYGRGVFASLGWRRPGINLLVVAIGGVVLAFLLSALGGLLKTPKIEMPFDQFTKSSGTLILFSFVAVVLAPLFEEMFFRGFIQPLLSRTFGTVAGILVTAALFGALHGFEYSWVWQYALFISLAGLVFGFLRARTNSIIPSTIMHGCFNAVSVIALAFGKNM